VPFAYRAAFVRSNLPSVEWAGKTVGAAQQPSLRRYQVHQSKEGVTPAAMNSSVAALRFFFRITLNHPG
jgi:integrase/recombinase XerD